MDGRDVHAGHGLLHQIHPRPQAHAFEPARNRNPSLQILAKNFGLPSFILELSQRADGGGLAGGAAGDDGVLDLIQRRVSVLWKTDANRVGMVVDNHRRRRRFALKNRTGIQFDLLGSKTRARGNHRIDGDHNRRSADGVLDPVFHIHHALDLLDLVGDLGPPIFQQIRVGRKQLDLHRLGGIGQIADHVLQDLREFDVKLRVLFVDFGPNLRNDFIDVTVAIAFQPNGEVAPVSLCDRGEPKLETGAPRGAIDLRVAFRIFSTPSSTSLVSTSDDPAGIR